MSIRGAGEFGSNKSPCASGLLTQLKQREWNPGSLKLSNNFIFHCRLQSIVYVDVLFVQIHPFTQKHQIKLSLTAHLTLRIRACLVLRGTTVMLQGFLSGYEINIGFQRGLNVKL